MLCKSLGLHFPSHICEFAWLQHAHCMGNRTQSNDIWPPGLQKKNANTMLQRMPAFSFPSRFHWIGRLYAANLLENRPQSDEMWAPRACKNWYYIYTRCPIQRQNWIFRHILISLHGCMAPVGWKVGPNQMRSGHHVLLKTDTNATCWIKCWNFTLRHIFVTGNPDDSMGWVEWKIHPNHMGSGHQRLVKTDAINVCWIKCRNFISVWNWLAWMTLWG